MYTVSYFSFIIIHIFTSAHCSVFTFKKTGQRWKLARLPIWRVRCCCLVSAFRGSMITRNKRARIEREKERERNVGSVAWVNEPGRERAGGVTHSFKRYTKFSQTARLSPVVRFLLQPVELNRDANCNATRWVIASIIVIRNYGSSSRARERPRGRSGGGGERRLCCTDMWVNIIHGRQRRPGFFFPGNERH